MAGYRIDRISEDIRRELISLMRELKDPRVQGKLLTVVNVKVSNDLGYAKAYVSSMDGLDDAKEACKGLKSAAGFLRRELGNHLHLRKAPELTFTADDSIQKGMEIFEKLKDTSNEN